MASISESGYGARLQNAQTISSFLKGFTNYSPPRTEDEIVAFEKLLDDCSKVNTLIASNTQSYTLAIKNRSDVFSGKDESSVRMIISPISKAVQSQYGKTSREYTSIATIVARMRSSKTVKPPTNPEEDQKETISKSEMSYGSQLQTFKDLVASLEQLNNFSPPKENLRIDKLKLLIDNLERLNQEVTTKTFPLSQARKQRRSLFEELNVRVQRIKSYVSAMYGNKSSEYKAISKLRI